MGTDKALVEVDGVALARRAGDRLVAAGAGEVVLVGAAEAVADRLAMATVPDDRPGTGPLAGVATALRWARGRAPDAVLLVAACDQPDLDPTLLDELVRRLGGGLAVGAIPRTADGRRHPFPSAWRVDAAAGAIERLVRGGARRMRDALELAVVEVEARAAAVADLDAPADLARRLDRSTPPPP